MNLRQLSYFLAVVDEASFTRGAQRAHVAQSSLSQQIRLLEAELGGPLIERLPRSIRLTAAGKAFLPEARAAVAAAERAARAARTALKLERGELEIATVRSLAVGVLPQSIERWHRLHPGVSIRLQEYVHRARLEEAVRSGIGDIAVGPRPLDWRGPISSLGWEEFVIVLPSADPAAREEGPLALERLADREWVLFPPHHGLSDLIAATCMSAGFQPVAAVRTAQVEAAARLAAAGLGPTLVPDNVVPAELAVNVRRLEPPVVRELVAYTRTEWSPQARAYLELIRDQDWKRRPARATVVP